MKHLAMIISACAIWLSSCAQPTAITYKKIERMIPMRDGVKLFTAIYMPQQVTEKVPFLMVRTPYSCRPYGENNMARRLGPSTLFANEPYIYVYQDVRGRYMSEGSFEEMTPHKDVKKTTKDVDESSDTYDTVDWLLKNIENNNGRVGIYGISYPGFYATASLPGAHPAIKAVSPQAPVTDEFEGDDAYHRGAFFLMDNYDFMNFFDYPRPAPWKEYPSLCKLDIDNAYDYYLQMGPVSNADSLCFKNRAKIWSEYLKHTTKDAYWQARDIRQHLKNIKPAVLVVGGWFDAEDLFGSLNTYETIEKNSPGNRNQLVMGPWTHGAWSRGGWDNFASHSFGSNVNEMYQKMEHDFFDYYLKDKGAYKTSEATIYETGSNKWKTYTAWPPKEVKTVNWYLGENKTFATAPPTASASFDSYVSDPATPVPYMETKGGDRNNEYMAADQRFATSRKDVLTYSSGVLENDVTVAGPITADLFASISTSDADFVVKVIDELPADAPKENQRDVAGMQRLVRAEVLRGKFRNSFVKPEPFQQDNVTRVKYRLNDIDHCFKKGHKIVIQIQSSWFPLVDRNPQQFMNIATAKAADFQPATIKIYHDAVHPSTIVLPQLSE